MELSLSIEKAHISWYDRPFPYSAGLRARVNLLLH
jgi:hypothetical protein